MGCRMGEMGMDRTETTFVEAILKDELEREDRALRSVAPVISHMLDTGGGSLVSDAAVARLRGMLSDIARQLLEAVTASAASDEEIDRNAHNRFPCVCSRQRHVISAFNNCQLCIWQQRGHHAGLAQWID